MVNKNAMCAHDSHASFSYACPCRVPAINSSMSFRFAVKSVESIPKFYMNYALEAYMKANDGIMFAAISIQETAEKKAVHSLV